MAQPSFGLILANRAVVLGASMAGLLAARVLADSYGQVTVIDRDQLPHNGTNRRGVPHGRHLHALLAAGQQVLEELFPGFSADLVAQGAAAGRRGVTPVRSSATVNGSGRDGRKDWSTASATIVCRAQQAQS